LQITRIKAYHTPDLGDVEGEAWLPNYKVPYFSGEVFGTQKFK
jgi:hypothetical protein